MEMLLLWAACGLLGFWITGNKGRGGLTGLVLGLLMGPFGVLLCLLLPTDHEAKERRELSSGRLKRCRHCLALVPVGATACRFCGRDA